AVRKLPNWSSIRICGGGPKMTPAVPVLGGWVLMVSRLAAAGLTVTLDDVALTKLPLVNWIVMLVATRCDKSVKEARPFTAVAVAVPCKVPAPAARAAVTTVLLSELIKLPKVSSTRTAGCWAKTTPAVAALEGWV